MSSILVWHTSTIVINFFRHGGSKSIGGLTASCHRMCCTVSDTSILGHPTARLPVFRSQNFEDCRRERWTWKSITRADELINRLYPLRKQTEARESGKVVQLGVYAGTFHEARYPLSHSSFFISLFRIRLQVWTILRAPGGWGFQDSPWQSCEKQLLAWSWQFLWNNWDPAGRISVKF